GAPLRRRAVRRDGDARGAPRGVRADPARGGRRSRAGPAQHAGAGPPSRRRGARRMTRLVIFDCDGVLVDSEPIAVRIDVEMLAEVGIAMTAEEVIERFVGRSPEVILAETEARLGRPVPEGWFERGEARIREAYATELKPVPGIVDALGAIEEPVCVASSSGHDNLRYKLELTGLYERFVCNVSAATDVANG